MHLKDDDNFLETPSDRDKHRRLDFVYHVVVHHCARNKNLAHETWVKLFNNDTDLEEIWLWADGDEALLLTTYGKWWWRSCPHVDVQAAASALSRRLQRIQTYDTYKATHQEDRQRRVQQEPLSTRLSVIAWLVITSKATRDSDTSRGFNIRETWDLECLIGDWYIHARYLTQDSNILDYDTSTFDGNMEADGHTCHQHFRMKSMAALRAWLKMRSFLNLEQRHDVIYLSLSTNSQCKPCAIRYAPQCMQSCVMSPECLNAGPNYYPRLPPRIPSHPHHTSLFYGFFGRDIFSMTKPTNG